MRTEVDAHRLRIYVNESDRWEGKPLYEAIIRAARDQGLAGATALRGIEGFGANNRIHTVKILRLSEDLPIVIEIIDDASRISAFVPTLHTMVAEGLMTIEKIRAVMNRREDGGPPPLDDDEELQLESLEFTPIAPEGTPGALPTTENVQKVFSAAQASATESRRVYADSVDVLMAMLCESDGIARRALKALGIDCDVATRSLRDEVSREEPVRVFLGRIAKRSATAARWLGDDKITTEHLLLALCEVRPSTATDVLMRLGALPRDICREVFTAVGHQDDWQRWMADHPDM
jgi:PII-like signaling protein